MVFFYPLIFPQERARIKNNRGKKYEKKKKKNVNLTTVNSEASKEFEDMDK